MRISKNRKHLIAITGMMMASAIVLGFSTYAWVQSSSNQNLTENNTMELGPDGTRVNALLYDSTAVEEHAGQLSYDAYNCIDDYDHSGGGDPVSYKILGHTSTVDRSSSLQDIGWSTSGDGLPMFDNPNSSTDRAMVMKVKFASNDTFQIYRTTDGASFGYSDLDLAHMSTRVKNCFSANGTTNSIDGDSSYDIKYTYSSGYPTVFDIYVTGNGDDYKPIYILEHNDSNEPKDSTTLAGLYVMGLSDKSNGYRSNPIQFRKNEAGASGTNADKGFFNGLYIEANDEFYFSDGKATPSILYGYNNPVIPDAAANGGLFYKFNSVYGNTAYFGKGAAVGSNFKIKCNFTGWYDLYINKDGAIYIQHATDVGNNVSDITGKKSSRVSTSLVPTSGSAPLRAYTGTTRLIYINVTGCSWWRNDSASTYYYDGTDWLAMSSTGTTGVYSANIKYAATTIKFDRVVGGTTYNTTGTLSLPSDKNYFTLNSSGNGGSWSYTSISSDGYYIVGNMNSYDIPTAISGAATYKMTAGLNSKTAGITNFSLANNAQFKVVRIIADVATWYGGLKESYSFASATSGNNVIMGSAAASTYDIYLNDNGNDQITMVRHFPSTLSANSYVELWRYDSRAGSSSKLSAKNSGSATSVSFTGISNKAGYQYYARRVDSLGASTFIFGNWSLVTGSSTGTFTGSNVYITDSGYYSSSSTSTQAVLIGGRYTDTYTFTVNATNETQNGGITVTRTTSTGSEYVILGKSGTGSTTFGSSDFQYDKAKTFTTAQVGSTGQTITFKSGDKFKIMNAANVATGTWSGYSDTNLSVTLGGKDKYFSEDSDGNIVVKYNGSYTIKSISGTGSTITFTIVPAVDADQIKIITGSGADTANYVTSGTTSNNVWTFSGVNLFPGQAISIASAAPNFSYDWGWIDYAGSNSTTTKSGFYLKTGYTCPTTTTKYSIVSALKQTVTISFNMQTDAITITQTSTSSTSFGENDRRAGIYLLFGTGWTTSSSVDFSNMTSSNSVQMYFSDKTGVDAALYGFETTADNTFVQVMDSRNNDVGGYYGERYIRNATGDVKYDSTATFYKIPKRGTYNITLDLDGNNSTFNVEAVGGTNTNEYLVDWYLLGQASTHDSDLLGFTWHIDSNNDASRMYHVGTDSTAKKAYDGTTTLTNYTELAEYDAYVNSGMAPVHMNPEGEFAITNGLSILDDDDYIIDTDSEYGTWFASVSNKRVHIHLSGYYDIYVKNGKAHVRLNQVSENAPSGVDLEIQRQEQMDLRAYYKQKGVRSLNASNGILNFGGTVEYDYLDLYDNELTYDVDKLPHFYLELRYINPKTVGYIRAAVASATATVGGTSASLRYRYITTANGVEGTYVNGLYSAMHSTRQPWSDWANFTTSVTNIYGTDLRLNPFDMTYRLASGIKHYYFSKSTILEIQLSPESFAALRTSVLGNNKTMSISFSLNVTYVEDMGVASAS